MASNITDPTTAYFAKGLGLHRFSKNTHKNTRREIEKGIRDKAKITGDDEASDIGASIIAAKKSKDFTDRLTKVRNGILAKPFDPHKPFSRFKPFAPKVAVSPVSPIKPVIKPVVMQPHGINAQTPHIKPAHSTFFKNYANKFKRPKF